MKIHHLVASIASGSILAASQVGVCELPRVKPPPPPLVQPPEIFLGPDEMVQLDTAVTLIDVRSAEDYAAGHCLDAVSLPASIVRPASPDPLRRRLAELGLRGDETVVLYGSVAEPEELGWVFLGLSIAGFHQIRVATGGYASLKALPRCQGTEDPTQLPVSFETPARVELLVEVDELRTLYGREGVEVLDLRQETDWEAYALPVLFRAGHIPHSLPFDARSMLREGSFWPEPLEARERLSALGPRASDPVDLRSTFILVGKDSFDRQVGVAFLLLRSLGLEVRFLVGGWATWQATSELPKVQVVDAQAVRRLLVAENPYLADKPSAKTILLDLREDWYFEEGHLPGAIFLSAYDFQEQFEELLQRYWPEIDRKTVPLVLYCFGPDCTRSRRCATWASRLGFSNLIWFRDGIEGWRQANFKIYGSLWGGPSRVGQASP